MIKKLSILHILLSLLIITSFACSNSTKQDDLFGAGAAGGAAADAGGGSDAPPPRKVGLAHIKDAPFSRGGQNLNTVYIARDGDTVDSVSQKLFGEDKSKMLKKANPTL